MSSSDLDALTISLGESGNLALSCILALMMFAVALGLRGEQFRAIARAPRAYLIGIAAQVIGLPLLTLGLVNILNPHPSLALGMILVACCPGGNVSNLFVLFARGNTALSVSMTATSSLMAALLTPISIVFWSGLYAPTAQLLGSIDFNVVSFLLQTLLILGAPIALGMAIAFWRADVAARLQKPAARISGLALIAIIVFGTLSYWDVLLQIGAVIIPLVIVHNLAAFALGYSVGWLSRGDAPTRRALTYEVGIQNSGLGLVILITQMSGLGGAAAITALWGVWHIIGGGAMLGVFRYADRGGETQKQKAIL